MVKKLKSTNSRTPKVKFCIGSFCFEQLKKLLYRTIY
jgi:hypothetical protein